MPSGKLTEGDFKEPEGMNLMKNKEEDEFILVKLSWFMPPLMLPNPFYKPKKKEKKNNV